MTQIELRPSIDLDSLKLRLPINLITLKDKSIFDHYAETNLNTGEVDPNEFKLKAKEYHFTETSKVKILIERRRTTKDTIEECLIIYLNSKVLRQRYFEGIHLDNINSIYKDLMSLNVFSVEYEVFLNAECTDIDFKFDERMTQDEWNELLNQFMQATIPTAEADKGYKRFKPTSKHPFQNGLMYNRRANATPSRPFLKLYWKGGELLSNSLDYKEEHFADVDAEDLKQIVRIETTIKNKMHAQKIGLNNLRLLNLLTLTPESRERIFRSMISKYLHKPTKQLKAEAPKDDRMTPDQQIQYYSIVLLMEHTNNKADAVIESLLQGIERKDTRYRKRKELNHVYNRYIKGQKVDLRVDKINSFFTKFGWV